MLYREIIAVCSQLHTKNINTVCGQNVEFLSVKPGGNLAPLDVAHDRRRYRHTKETHKVSSAKQL